MLEVKNVVIVETLFQIIITLFYVIIVYIYIHSWCSADGRKECAIPTA